MAQKIFFLWGEKIEIDDNMRKYALISNKFADGRDHCITALVEMAERASNPDYIAQTLYSDYINRAAAEIISELSRHGVFDRTVSDFAPQGAFDGYLHTYLESVTNASVTASDAERQSIRAARNYADGMVTGLPFGVITNNLVGLGVYALQDSSEKKKQAQQANIAYQRMTAAAREKRENTISFAKKSARGDFLQSCLDSTVAIYATMEAVYLSVLQQIGQFDSSCLDGISPERSSEMLKNTEILEDKKPVILCAIKACPYNPDVYISCIQQDIFDDELISLCRYFELETSVCRLLRPIITQGDRSLYEVERDFGKYFLAVSRLCGLSYQDSVSLYIKDTTDKIYHNFTEFCTYFYQQSNDVMSFEARRAYEYLNKNHTKDVFLSYVKDKDYAGAISHCTVQPDEIDAASRLFGPELLTKLSNLFGCTEYNDYPKMLHEYASKISGLLDQYAVAIKAYEIRIMEEKFSREQAQAKQDAAFERNFHIWKWSAIISFIFLVLAGPHSETIAAIAGGVLAIDIITGLIYGIIVSSQYW